MTIAEAGAMETALHDTERDVLSVVLYLGHVPAAAQTLTPDDFADTRWRAIWSAMLALHERGLATDASTVAVELARRDDQAVRVGRHDLLTLSGEAAIPAALPTYVGHVREASRRRHVGRAATRLRQAAGVGDPGTAERLVDEVLRDLAAQRAESQPAAQPADLLDFISEPDHDRDQIVPGLLERGERIILTAGEGAGKSTLLRQIALQTAAGIHPFTLDPIDPLSVLLIDVENPRRHLKRELRKLHSAVARHYTRGQLHIESRPQGLDLLDPTDQAWLLDRVRATMPALIVTGPLYKLASGDPTEERTARVVAQVLDDARVLADAALILEAHTPHASNGQRKRPLRPYGASLWLRWPEFGLNLGDDGILRHWRGARDERNWPLALQRGGAWPWTVDHRDPTDITTGDLDDDQRACLDVIRNHHPDQMSTTQIADATHLHRSRVSKACNALTEQRPPLLDKYDTGAGKPAYYSLPEGV